LRVDKNQVGKSSKRYYWLALVIGGMAAGLMGCLVYSYVTKGDHSLLSSAVGNPKADEANVRTDPTEEKSVSPSAFLGVEIMSVNAVIAEQFGLSNPCGVLVNSVVDGSPAQESGLRRSDVILSLNSIAVEDVNSFRNIMSTLNPGDNVKIVYIRNRQKDTVYATLADSSAVLNVAKDTSGSDWSVLLSVLNSDLRSSLRIPDNIDGIVILSVTPGGLADQAGLLPGDVITGINNTPIADMSDFFGALSSDKDDKVLLDVYSQGTLRYVALDSSGVVSAVARTQTSLLDRILSVFTDNDNVILTEHTNEEDDYEKPVCKRLEESGERYKDEE